MARGTMKWFDRRDGGYIAPVGGGDDLFVEADVLENPGGLTHLVGQVVEYEVDPASGPVRVRSARVSYLYLG